MKFILIVFDDFDKKKNYLKSSISALSTISNQINCRYALGEKNLIIAFDSELSEEEVYLFVDDLFYNESNLFILVPYDNDIFTSLPLEIHSYLFGQPQYEEDDIYYVDAVELVDQEFTLDEFIKKNIKKEKKHLSLDEILDKITISGIESLNENELNTLKNFSK